MLTAVDLLPTFLDVAGVPLPKGYQPDGESALAAFKGSAIERTKPIYWQWRGGDNQDFTWPTLGVRDGKWKLLVGTENQKSELYDLENDWAETTDVSARHPDVTQRLSDQLAAWKNELPQTPSKQSLSKARRKKK